ncbi:Clavaminate synthase-like protein [Punctularia strigosozonata HHB-11173 SS5]|uniref:Clavaminate synthase-like protein n=1 Tax=Punctularia strigosozonata (strain HHB-11173) TaxID=741275 RepID=R7S328_PUNST|nr:Clavaminate synthase-like protein [Punctularia strigosozonata HHB-11173 SS5]EIN04785.1 Clavaminate synthase-like protein [Punctularia strigosozonata HHB-11173 SS5]
MLPPFPQDVPTYPLAVVDYECLVAGDEKEVDDLWKAATSLGVWYMKNHGTDLEVDGMFEMGKRTINLPLEEKMKFERGDSGLSHGYKPAGGNVTDEYGNMDAIEYLTIAKDDVLSYPAVARKSYPGTVNACMEDVLKPFVLKSTAINETLLRIFGQKLGLPDGTLESQHKLEAPSGSEARCTKVAARTEPSRVALGGHTDFGSLTILHNRLGGLQILAPGTDSWQYVKPLPGHAICNIGDALTMISGGTLPSIMHRVVRPPPGEQSGLERWSLVYFTRPGDSVPLRAFAEESPLIAASVARMSESDKVKYAGSTTAQEWFIRRAKNQRAKNYLGPETWKASRGMEHRPEKS